MSETPARKTHSPECANAKGPCCPWMTGANGEECDCQCTCDYIATITERVLDEEEEHTQERIQTAYLEGRETTLRQALADLETRIVREQAENDPDGLLNGLQYAHERLTTLAEAWTDDDAPTPIARHRRSPIGSVLAGTCEPVTLDHPDTYAAGYVAGIKTQCWTCGDCGNTYQATIDHCPNRELDEAIVATYKDTHHQ